ncbi:hypothetical protein ABE137_11005 [Brevibacillus laterosporus]|uniref:hypothetical protein n=1 Tax=Brevibacillus laterosporus TaxID=1465 RepID=UPI003D234F21
MYYQNFINIKQELLLSDSVYKKSQDVFKRLKPFDTLTTGVFSRKTDLSFEMAERVLVECVNKGVLSIVIVVPCSKDAEHPPLVLNSLKEFTTYVSNRRSSLCTCCESEYDYDNARIAFKRPIFDLKVQ